VILGILCFCGFGQYLVFFGVFETMCGIGWCNTVFDVFVVFSRFIIGWR